MRIVPGSTMQLVTHQATATLLRREMFDDREHLVAPVVPIVAGVLNGELVPAEEIGRYPDAWNGIPLPVGHPTDEQGIPISANAPRLVERAVGRFWGAEFAGDRLRGELWVDVERCRELGGDAVVALHRLEAGLPLEVSTSYWRDIEESSGTYAGEPYDAIARNLRPDHLALLPHDIGACNWQDGCGAPRTNQADESEQSSREVCVMSRINIGPITVPTPGARARLLGGLARLLGVKANIDAEDLSHSDIEQRLRAALGQLYGQEWVYLVDVFEGDAVIVYEEPSQEGVPGSGGRLLQRGYVLDDDGAVTFGEPVEVQRITSYEPVSADTADAVDAVASEPAQNDARRKAPMVQAVTRIAAPAGSVSCAQNAAPANPIARAQVHIAQISDPEVRAVINEAVADRRARREQTIEALAANMQCAFSREDLAAMNDCQLSKLARSLQVPDYSGRGMPRANAVDAADVIPPPPPVVLRRNAS